MTKQKPIYLDYNATTPLTPTVIEAMEPFLNTHFGNPSSTHFYGQIPQDAVENARSLVAQLINASPGEIVFTSGGTESNNMAIRGVAKALSVKGKHIITSAVEHPAVTEVCRYLEQQGVEVTVLPVDQYGAVSPSDLQKTLRPDTILVSMMHANNEVGTIQPIKSLSEITHQAGALFHTDAAQSTGKIPVDVEDLGVDLLSLAGHKLYAPKGVGALYIRSGVKIDRIMFGAGQEMNRRPGTENVLEIVGLGAAAESASATLQKNKAHFKAMRDRLHAGLQAALPSDQLRLNGHPEKRLPNTLNISFKDIEANVLLNKIQDVVAASAGAACHADQVRVSDVIAAMRVPIEWAKGTVRFSVGRMTTAQEIDEAVRVVVNAVTALHETL
mgnify:CR=1 FL=1